MANVSTVGQDKTPSPWGTYDQGSNVVEILDTLAPRPPGYNSGDPAIERIYPWEGFRIGVIGTP
jgi:hypothetical protein